MGLAIINYIIVFVVSVVTSTGIGFLYLSNTSTSLDLFNVTDGNIELMADKTIKLTTGTTGTHITQGKVGIGMAEPIWPLDVMNSYTAESGTGDLTPQLTHYNTARFQQQTTSKSNLQQTDLESVYGVLQYNAQYPTTRSYLVGIHGDIYINGPANLGPQMMAGLWGSATYDGTGNLVDMLMGVRGEITVNSGSGVRLASIYAAKPELNGGQTDYAYGVFIEDMSGMGIQRAASPYAIYSVGDNPSYFAGKLGIGTDRPVVALDIAAESGIRIGPKYKHIDMFSSGAGNDINSVGGELFVNFDKNFPTNIANSTFFVGINNRVGIGTNTPEASLHLSNGNLLINNNFAIQFKNKSNEIRNILNLTSDNSVKIYSASASLFVNPDATSETAINYTNNSNILLGYSSSGWLGKIGIGTINPEEKVHISGGNLLIENNNSIKFKSNTGTTFEILSVKDDNAIRLKSAGASIFVNPDNLSETAINYRNDSNVIIGYNQAGWLGKVGIGTTNPVVALDINSPTGVKIGSDSKGLRLYANGIGSDINSLGGTLFINYEQLQAIDLGNGSVFIASDGKVGIGTTLPTTGLDINGSVKVSGTLKLIGQTTNALLITDATGTIQTTTAGTSGQVLAGTTGSAPTWTSLSAIDHSSFAGLTDDDHTQYALLNGRTSGQKLIGGSGSTDSLGLQSTSGVGADGANIKFLVGNNGSIEALTITNDGKIGIGVTNPTYLVDVNKDTLRLGQGSTGANWTSLYIDAGSNGGANNTEGRVIFSKNNNPQWQIYNTATQLSFFDYLGNGNTLTLDSGKVGVGTTTPQGKLDVNSTTGGLVVPRMTTTERDLITPVNGTIIYNTTTNQFNFYENGAWVTK